MRHLSLLKRLLLALGALWGPLACQAEIQHVIFISVDGLRGDFLENLVSNAPAEFPNFLRLRNGSAFTFNARCDYHFSETVPNHITMLTGRPVSLPAGFPETTHHGYISNFPGAGDTIHLNGNPAAAYKASIFDVVHDRGLSTTLLVSKDRLTICERSYSATTGAPDLTGANNGRDKIDFTQIAEANSAALLSTLLLRMSATFDRFTFFHIAETDYAGHGSGWSITVGSAYRQAIKTVDGQLGSILDKVAQTPALVGKVAIVLTGDHGGGGMTINTHNQPEFAGNYTIPFFVWAAGFAGGSNLYPYFENRVDPGSGRPTYTDPGQPIRNADVANLCAGLLGLPEVPGSFAKPQLKTAVSVLRETGQLSVRWPAYLTGYTLESTDSLSAANWQPVVTGITETQGEMRHTVAEPAPDARFFRLRKPADQPSVALQTLSSSAVAPTVSAPKPTVRKRRYQLLKDGSVSLAK